MKIAASRSKRKALSMTSLIDVIFLLLLFFMLTSTFIRHQEVTIATPNAEGAQGRNTPDAILRAGADGAIRLNGESVPQSDLRARLAAIRESGASNLLVSASDDADSQTLVRAVEAANSAGFEQVAVAQ